MNSFQNFNFKPNVSNDNNNINFNVNQIVKGKKKYLKNNNNCTLYNNVNIQNDNVNEIDNNKTINKKKELDIFDIKTGFYWENLNQKYPYNPKLKYCIFFNGCCCPPHKGHISSIKSAIKMLPGCNVIINQLASSSRHGVPSNYNSELLQKYLSIIFNNNPNIKYMFRASNKQIFTHDFITNCDVLVIIRGDEIEERNKLEISKNINKKNEFRFSKYINKLNDFGIKVDFYMQYRNVNKVSATKFIEKLNDYKNKININKRKEDLYEIMNFIPEEVDFDSKYRIIKKLLKFDTWVKK